jgi:hypothetical protein
MCKIFRPWQQAKEGGRSDKLFFWEKKLENKNSGISRDSPKKSPSFTRLLSPRLHPYLHPSCPKLALHSPLPPHLHPRCLAVPPTRLACSSPLPSLTSLSPPPSTYHKIEGLKVGECSPTIWQIKNRVGREIHLDQAAKRVRRSKGRGGKWEAGRIDWDGWMGGWDTGRLGG